MKALLSALLLFAVLAVLLVGGFFVMTMRSTPDTSELSSTTAGEVVRAEPGVRSTETYPEHGHTLTYHYVVDGTTYASTTFYSNAAWSQGQPLRICYAPDDPTRHAPRLETDPPCGAKFYDSIVTATRVD